MALLASTVLMLSSTIVLQGATALVAPGFIPLSIVKRAEKGARQDKISFSSLLLNNKQGVGSMDPNSAALSTF
jgi:hypothetical protein